MPAPFSRQFFPDLRDHAKVTRYIDNHYHLEMIAENQKQLVEYQEDSLRMQHETSLTNIRAMGEVANRQDQANSLLSTLVGDMDMLNVGMDQINFSMENLNAAANKTIDLLYEQTEVLERGFEQIAIQMFEQKRELQEISKILRAPYETKALELFREADNALSKGMKSSGRDQDEEYKDAVRLLQLVLDNPIGSRNFFAWFHTGWLNWKFKLNFAEAEEAFYQAARLSDSLQPSFHAYSQQHCAHMQYLQDRFGDAYNTIHKALRITPDNHETLHEAARYASRTGRENETLELLDKCIDLQPQTIHTIFSEEDFLLSDTLQQVLACLILRKTEEGRAKAQRAIESWQRVVDAVPKAEKMAEHKISLFCFLTNEQVQEEVQMAASKVHTAPYILAVDLTNKATAKRDSILKAAASSLQKEIEHRQLTTESMAKQELEAAKIECSSNYNLAVEKINRAFDFGNKELLGVDTSGSILFSIMVIWIVSSAAFIYYFFTGLFGYAESFWANTLLFLGTLYLLFQMSWWIFSIYVKLFWKRVEARKNKLKADSDSARKRAKEEAESPLRKAEAAIEERRKVGETYRNKAEGALQWLMKQA